jgi:hypothetical protein
MTDTPTPADVIEEMRDALKKLRFLCDQTSSGPWFIRYSPKNDGQFILSGQRPKDMAYALEILGEDYTGFGDNEQRHKDAEFVVAARNIIAALALPDSKPDNQGGA